MAGDGVWGGPRDGGQELGTRLVCGAQGQSPPAKITREGLVVQSRDGEHYRP